MEPNLIIATYQTEQSLRAAARKANVSCKTALKVLCSAGIYPSDRAKRVNELAEHMTVEEIAQALKISPKSVMSYLPYTKGTYLTEDKSKNALAIAKCRAGKEPQSK